MTIDTKDDEEILGLDITLDAENPEALIGAVVKVDDTLCGTIENIPSDGSNKVTLRCQNAPITGDAVTIKAADDKKLGAKEIGVLAQGKIFVENFQHFLF